MKKICFVIPRTYYLFNPKISGKNIIPGGAQVQVYYMSTALAEDKDFSVHFVVADYGQSEFEKIKNVKLHRSFKLSEHIFKRIKKLIKTLKKIDADTYIFRSADPGVAFAVFYVKKFLKRKTLYMLASDVETSVKRQKKHSGFLTAFSMRYVYKNADYITSQTLQQKQLFEKNRKRNTDALIKNIFPEIKTSEIYENKNTVLWVGRLTQIKKPELFINLSKEYPDEKFIMIAPLAVGKEEYGKAIQVKAKQIKNLQLINYVNPSEISKYYKSAKIYCITSELEGFSNTMVEALQNQCTILSYNVNPDNILNEYNFGFCAEKNMEKFRKDFEQLSNNFELMKKMGQNGANYIKENHRKKEITETFKQLL